MKERIQNGGICPKCGQPYTGRPALSRADDRTAICPDCGTLEALQSIGIPEAEQKEILAIIHHYQGG